MTTHKKLYRDPENIGWAGCVYINNKLEILLVKNLKRLAQMLAEFVRRGFSTEENQRLHYKEVLWVLRQKGLLEKPSKWELLGGKISYWQGNPELREEFQNLSSEDAKKTFDETVGARVLFDDKLLERAADGTAESEFVEEGGLVISEKCFLTRVNDTDRTDPKNSFLFYPRFWYLVTLANGTLRTEPVKGSISEPHWIPLLKLHPTLNRDGLYPIHHSHVLGICAAARHLIRNGKPEFAEVVNYLERTFGPQKETATFEEASDWDEFTKTVEKLK